MYLSRLIISSISNGSYENLPNEKMIDDPIRNIVIEGEHAASSI